MRGLAVVVLLALLAPALAGCLEPAANAWATRATQIDLLRKEGLSGRSIRVAILDSGIDLDHPSLRHLTNGDAFDGELLGYADFVGQSGSPRDLAGHGTYVAGILAAQPPGGVASLTASSSSVQGLAPDVDLLVARVCASAHCDLGAVWQGLEWAVRQGADVISISLGFTPAEVLAEPFVIDRFRQSLGEAEKAGILVVSAAGNTPGGVMFPANEPTVLAVAAMGRDGAAVGYGERWGDAKPDLVAPGEGIVGPERGGGRVSRGGTSAAVPFVVAAAALAMSGFGDPDSAEEIAALRNALLDSAKPLPGQRRPHDPSAGHGLLQAQLAAVLFDDRFTALRVLPETGRSTGTPAAKTPSPMNVLPVATAWSSTTS